MNEILKRLVEQYDDHTFTIMDGYDDCVMGVVSRCGMEPVILYDVEKVIEKNMSFDMTYLEALEYFEFNQAGSYVGPETPMFFYK